VSRFKRRMKRRQQQQQRGGKLKLVEADDGAIMAVCIPSDDQVHAAFFMSVMHMTMQTMVTEDSGIKGITFLKQAVLSQPKAVKLLISATGDDALISRAYSIGASDFLQKPFTVETLWATLVMHVRKNGSHGEEIFEKAILVNPTENRR